MSLKDVVGQKVYDLWLDMLRRLVPDGRTHRLAPMIAGMLQYVADVAIQKFGDEPEEGTAAYYLLGADEIWDPGEAGDLQDLVAQLFEDAGVEYERVNSRGEGYSVAESAIYEYIHWYDMPWEA
jgi:hypothetical protein